MIDLVGYIGTGLVVASFLSRSMIRLRLLNAVGALLVTIYALKIGAYPVAILDGLIMIINFYHLIRMNTKDKKLSI